MTLKTFDVIGVDKNATDKKELKRIEENRKVTQFFQFGKRVNKRQKPCDVDSQNALFSTSELIEREAISLINWSRGEKLKSTDW